MNADKRRFFMFYKLKICVRSQGRRIGPPCAGRESASSSMRLATGIWQRFNPWEVGLLVGVLLLALFMRVYRLDSIPSGLYLDEGDNGFLCTTPATASSMSASWSMTMQFFPPISHTTRFISRWPGRTTAAFSIMESPTSLLPVKAICAVSG